MNKLFINKNTWKTFNDVEMDKYVSDVFDHYRDNGFPYYPTNDDWRKNEYRKFINYKKPILVDNTLRQTMHGLALCWSYHPYSFNIQCRNMMTPIEAYQDDGIFRKVIRKRIQRGDNMSDAGIRKTLKTYTGTQGVSNFRPTAAREIYNTFGNKGVVWDMSFGFGGRLLGFSDSTAKVYIGTDPMTNAYNANLQLISDFVKDKEVHLLKLGSEIYRPERNSLDLAFTSPPYFNIEKYSHEETQSYIKFSTRVEWLNGFLYETINNAVYGLKKNGYLILNVNDELVTPILSYIKKIKLNHLYTINLALSKINATGFKYEPTLVFQK